MQFRNVDDIPPEIEELFFLSFNIYLYYDAKKDCWVLCKYTINDEFYKRDTYLPPKIAEFGSIGELLLHLLQSNEEPCRLISIERDALIKCINFVFSIQDNGVEGDYKLRYHWYMQFQNQRPVRGSEFHIPSYFIRVKARSMGLPEPKDASDLLRLARKSNYFIGGNGIKQFGSCEELAWWALDDIVWHSKQIARCKICEQYFIKSKQHRIYCSADCANKGVKLCNYLDEAEIKHLSDIVNQRFLRKRKSQSLYIYNETTYDKGYNEFDVFSDIKENDVIIDPTVTIFNHEHFEQMWKTYSGFRKTRYKVVKTAKKAYLSGKITEKQYKSVLDSFITWIENVAKQLSAFSLNR